MPSFRWQGHAQDLMREVAISYAKGENMDCVFEADGGLIKGHKLIITAASPYLKQILEKHDGNEPVLMKQVKYHDLRIIFDFVYGGSVDVPVSEVSSFIRTANLLQIAPFQKLYCSNASEKSFLVENDRGCDAGIPKEEGSNINLSWNTSDVEKNDPDGNKDVSHPSFETILLPSAEAVLAIQKRRKRRKVHKALTDCQQSSFVNVNELENSKGSLSEDDKTITFPQNEAVNEAVTVGTNSAIDTPCTVDDSINDEVGENEDCDLNLEINSCTEKTVESTSSAPSTSGKESASICDNLAKSFESPESPHSPSALDGSNVMDTNEESVYSELADGNLVEKMEEDETLESLGSESELGGEEQSESLDLTVNKELNPDSVVHADVVVKEDESSSCEEDNAMVDEKDSDMEAEIGGDQNVYAPDDPLNPFIPNSVFGSTHVPPDVRNGNGEKMIRGICTIGEEETYRCFLCVAVFSAKSDYERHFSSHARKKVHRCNVCSSTFRFKSLLERHVRIHTKDKTLYTCEVCKAAFYSSSDLRTHLRTHEGVKPFPCNLCDAGFNYKCVLKRHLRTHTGERPYSCNICQATFVESGTLKYHLRTHTGEKPFVCTICQAAFTKRDSLKTHLRIHSGEKPFSCSICQINFTYKSTLRRHMRTHKE